MIGDRRPYNVALIVLDPDALRRVRGRARPRRRGAGSLRGRPRRVVAAVADARRRRQRAPVARRADQAFEILDDGLAARRRRADADDEAQAQADRREVRRRDRGPVLRLNVGVRPTLAACAGAWALGALVALARVRAGLGCELPDWLERRQPVRLRAPARRLRHRPCPHPEADPFCVEFDKRRQNVTELGVVDFLSKEPARVAAASSSASTSSPTTGAARSSRTTARRRPTSGTATTSSTRRAARAASG